MTAVATQESTKVNLSDTNFEPVNNEEFPYTWLTTNSDASSTFEIYYIKYGDKVIEAPYSMTNEVVTLNSLFDIGNIIFKNSRSLSGTESSAMNSYFKKKYKKMSQ